MPGLTIIKGKWEALKNMHQNGCIRFARWQPLKVLVSTRLICSDLEISKEVQRL